MTAYLITFKPASENPERGWPEEELAALARRVKAQGTAREPWRFNRRKDVKVGERVFLLRQGRQGHAILGYGRVAALPKKKSDRMTDVAFEALVDPTSGFVYATADEVHEIAKNSRLWRIQSSGIALPDDLAESLESLVVGRAPFKLANDRTASNPDWTRDELILALDVYLRHRPNPPDKGSKEIIALSNLLQRLGQRLFPADERATSFRNANGVYMKLMNFRRLDPQYTGSGKKGLTRGAKGEEDVWKEFATDPARCRRTAEAIIGALDDPEAGETNVQLPEEIEEAPEGRLLTRKHLARERNRKLVEAKRAKTLRDRGKLECEICGFDFAARYGPRGTGFIECHHTKPIASLSEGHKTHIHDLALVCANCHRMIHRTKPWLALDELRRLLTRDQQSR